MEDPNKIHTTGRRLRSSPWVAIIALAGAVWAIYRAWGTLPSENLLGWMRVAVFAVATLILGLTSIFGYRAKDP